MTLPAHDPQRPAPPGSAPAAQAEPRTPNSELRTFGFERSTDALFLLDRQRRLRFVNRAWEALTGLAAADVYLLYCKREKPALPADGPRRVLAYALCPPPEVLGGASGRARRRLPSADGRGWRWWDVEFLPFREGDALRGVLGRVLPLPSADGPAAATLPETLAALRERVAGRSGPGLLDSALPAVRRLAEQVRLAARVDAPVLLVGEPGTGKATLARVIHYQGPARERPLAVVDCARLPAYALAALLFGERGGAAPGRPGAVYLREPSALPRDLQLRLCDVLRGGAGGVRFLAGCTRPPAEEVRAGRLLDELHATLGTLVIEVPPLRERRADLPALVERLLARAGEAGGPEVAGLTAAAWEVARAHPWPGNLRELYAVLSAARRRAKGRQVDAADLPAALRLAHQLGVIPGPDPQRPLPLDPILEQVERRLIQLAMRRTGGHQTKAAELLAIWRPRLARRLKALGLEELPEVDVDEDGTAGEGDKT
jgi:hypothetical protein